MPKPIALVNTTNATSRNRKVVTMAWNTDKVDNVHRRTFRNIMNAGDAKSRVNYSCGGPNPLSNLPSVKQNVSLFRGGIKSFCDSSGVPASACNVKYVYDSSNFTRFRKEGAVNKNYNDTSFGGANNGSYSSIKHARM